MLLPSPIRLAKWSIVYLLFVLAAVASLHSVSAREISSVSVDLIEDGKEKEAIIDLKQKDDKAEGHKHKSHGKKHHKSGDGKKEKDNKDGKNKKKHNKKKKENIETIEE
ncbi:hypothetical protein RUM43_005946 [Polyplax serrata]|uniref:Uncharacterized protein n=1 Tax=Polyplax serrata TaxID=468196 RepID=A0AAN8S556_POLSC